ncbi:hypothetical protein WKI13_11655 [Teredinibacter turnerae]|nr:hypothetical protein [Teredinibacter turnerae]
MTRARAAYFHSESFNGIANLVSENALAQYYRRLWRLFGLASK